AIVTVTGVLLFRALPRVLEASTRMAMALVAVFSGSNERAARALQVLDRTGPGGSSADRLRRGHRASRQARCAAWPPRSRPARPDSVRQPPDQAIFAETWATLTGQDSPGAGRAGIGSPCLPVPGTVRVQQRGQRLALFVGYRRPLVDGGGHLS